MNILKQFFMTAVFALLLVTTSAFGDECIRVKAVAYETGYFEGPEACDGFGFCISYTLKGKPKGELWLYSTYYGKGNQIDEDYQRPDPFETELPFWLSNAMYHLYTEDGEIYMSTNAIYDNDTTVFAELSIVTGGTGKYVNATGNVVGYIDSREPSDNYYAGPIYYLGRICGPNIPYDDDDDDDDHEYYDNDDEYY